MNDETLDTELQELMASTADVIDLDPEGVAAQQLLESIVGQEERGLEPASIGPDMVDLNLPKLSGPAPRRTRLLAVAASCIAIAILTAGAWFFAQDDLTDVTTTSPTEDAFDLGSLNVNNEARELIGLDAPIVVVFSNEFDDSDSQNVILAGRCIETQMRSDRSWLAYAGVDVVAVEDFATAVWLTTADSTFSCRGDFPSWSTGGGPRATLSDETPVIIEGTGASFSDGGPSQFEVSGQVSPDVTEIRILTPETSQQSFTVSGSRFYVDAVSESRLNKDGMLLEITFIDGRQLVAQTGDLISGGSDRCHLDEECVADRIVELGEQAASKGLERQSKVLSDAHITQLEYEDLVERFGDCLARLDLDVRISEATLAADSSTAKDVDTCYEAELRFVDDALVWHNSAVPASNIANVADVADDAIPEKNTQADSDEAAAIEELDRRLREAIREQEARIAEEVEAALIRNTARERQIASDANDLFVDGLSELELTELWSGYPYREEEKQQRIAQYQSDFEWIQAGPIDIDVVLHFQFPQSSDFFEPIVTVRSLEGDIKVAAFVMGWSDGALSIGRIPELDERAEGPIGSRPIWARDDESITIPGVGVEGGVSAFLDGERLETLSDHLTLTTEISIPAGTALPAIITVVAATPELPGASIVVLDPISEEPLRLSDATTDCYAVGTYALAEDVTLFQVEPKFDADLDDYDGLDQETHKLFVYTQSAPEVTISTESNWLDVDGDGQPDTLQRIDIVSRAEGREAEGYRVCGTSEPTISFWNDPEEGPLVARIEQVDGFDWPRGGLVLGSSELLDVTAGQTDYAPENAYTFTDDGYLILISEVDTTG